VSDIVVHPNCYKHGLELEDALSGWSNVLAYSVRESFSGDRMVVLGYDTKSRLCEVIGLRKPYGWPLIHAMTPPTKKTVLEVSGGGRLW
jgi:hypothetical protein